MESPLYQRWAKLEERLDVRLDSLTLLRENRTCWIYLSQVAGERVVLKQYKHHARQLCSREAVAVSLYSSLCRELRGLLPSEIRAVNPETGTLCITFIEGELMSDVLRRGARSARERTRCCSALERVGELLARMRERTARPGSYSPFLEEYMVHVSRLLEETPGLGAVFKGYSATALHLFEDLRDAAEETSLSHGDLVCANLILSGDRVGVIDFANANLDSHYLDDVYNLRVTCQNLLHLPRGFRRDLMLAIASSVDLEQCDARTHRFFWEYHKRRWLHLQLCGSWARRARALALLPGMVRQTEPLTLSGPPRSELLSAPDGSPGSRSRTPWP
jgi:tRNA A-37 threonylcarbamoyl transferase component Bud32